MGMENRAVDLPEEEGIFTLASIKTAGDLEAIRDVDLSKMDASEMDVVGSESGGSDEESDDDDDRCEMP